MLRQTTKIRPVVALLMYTHVVYTLAVEIMSVYDLEQTFRVTQCIHDVFFNG